MAQTLRRMRPLGAALPLSLLWLGPLLLAIASLVASLSSGDWQGFWALPHVQAQTLLSLAIGTASTSVAVAIALWLAVSVPAQKASRFLGAYLAVPHVAFAVGLTFLIMPAGLIARLFFDEPPAWPSVQDPYGIGLILALVLKEVPFLLWLMVASLTRTDFANSLAAQQRVSHSLGHGHSSTAWRILAPQLLHQLVWPIVIVWVYGCSVVDMALVIGPTQPAPLQIALWRDLNDADAAINGRGLAGAAFLTLLLALVGGAFALAWKSTRWLRRAWLVRGPDSRSGSTGAAGLALGLIGLVYGLVVALLLMLSFTQRWPFPQLLPSSVSANAWAVLFTEPQPLLYSLGFACATSLSGLALSVLWFECNTQRWDKLLAGLAVVALALPAIALAAGQYQLMLRLGLNASPSGVYLAQLAPVLAYMFLTLVGPYRAFDQRYRAAALSLNSSELRFLLRVKWPLLKGPLASAAAIGFSVSMAQYVSVQLVGAGNTPTLTTEAVTLASGGNRAVLAAFALALAALTAAAFAAAAWIGGRRAA